jgi:glycerol uptake operon antiterminator
MNFGNQKILPAARNFKDLEKILESKYEYLILLDSHITQLKGISDLVHRKGKKIILHADLVQGLKNDEYGTQFLCQEICPFGIISTRSQVIVTAKKKGIMAIQRLFLLDSGALETSYRLHEQTKPDFVEVLPGIIPHIIREIVGKIKIPIIAGGLIRTHKDVTDALQAGAVAVTTSDRQLWNVKS